jgi:phosphotransferase system  glucose/maltose/N-acetylglucosamine-specific IIC component
MHLTPASFTITAEYSCYLVWAFMHFMIGGIFMLLACFVFWSPLASAWFKGGYWWMFVFIPIAFLLLVIAVCMFMKRKEDVKTKKRNLELYKALNEANDLFLKDTNLRLQGGDYGAWIELVDEDRKDLLNQ